MMNMDWNIEGEKRLKTEAGSILTDKDGGDAPRTEAERRPLRLLPGRGSFSADGLEVRGEGVDQGGAQLRPTHWPLHRHPAQHHVVDGDAVGLLKAQGPRWTSAWTLEAH